MHWKDFTSAKQVLDAREANQARLAELQEEREKIIEESTEARLERNRAATMRAMSDQGEITKAESQLLREHPRPERIDAIVGESKLLMAQERGLANEFPSGLAQKYVRTDAVKHFGMVLEEARAEESKLLRELPKGPNVQPGPRVLTQLEELRATIRDAAKIQRYAQVGEQIARLREQREALQVERQELEQKHREAVLS